MTQAQLNTEAHQEFWEFVTKEIEAINNEVFPFPTINNLVTKRVPQPSLSELIADIYRADYVSLYVELTAKHSQFERSVQKWV